MSLIMLVIVMVILYHINAPDRKTNFYNQLDKYGHVFGAGYLYWPQRDRRFNQTGFQIRYPDYRVSVEPTGRMMDLDDDNYLELTAALPLDLPDFTLRKSSNISQILFTSDLLPDELSNVNLETADLTQVAMWFNVSAFVKFISYFLPFPSKHAYIRSSSDLFKFQLYCRMEFEELEAAMNMIYSFYSHINELLSNETKRKQIRIQQQAIALHCKFCGRHLNFEDTICNSCGEETANCVVCYLQLTAESGVLNCCGSYMHEAHLEAIGSRCPYCKQEPYQLIELYA